MKSLPVVRHAIAMLAMFAVSASVASAGFIPIAHPMTMQPVPTGPLQWTVKINVAVDHIPSKFTATGVMCQAMRQPGSILIAEGVSDQPLTGGAFSGVISVPMYLMSGQLAINAQFFDCKLYLKDSSGAIQFAGEGTDPLAQPRSGTSFTGWLTGNLSL